MDEKNSRMTVSVSTGTIIKIVLVLLGLYALFYLRDVLLILLTSVVIASAIEPGTRFFVKHKVPRVVAVVLIYLFLLVLFVGLFYLIIPSFITNLSEFMNMLPNYVTALNVKTRPTTGLTSDFFNWQSAVSGLSHSESLGQAAQNLTTSLSTASGGILAGLTAVFGGVTSFLLIVVISFYLSVQQNGVEEFLRLVTPLKKETYIISLWRRTQHKIGKWIQGQLLLAVLVGFLVYIGLTILGVKNAFFLALISTVFEIIPVFGPIVGAIPGILVGTLQGGVAFGFIIALMYIIVQQIESNVIYPLVVKKVINVHPLVVIIALVVGAKLGGFLGVVLSVPVATALTEFMSDVNKNRIAARERNSIIND